MSRSSALLIAGSLEHLMRYQLTGCSHSAHIAAHLLDELAERPDVNGDTRALCGCMSEALGERGCHV
ncbi:MAG: hypothetical protein HZB71_09210 [Betaproteobacteria bacterium]|nr:hypothetical protein [Betaproteobacteria bacterium]